MPNIVMTNRIMQIHLASWRYFALLTLPPLFIAFNLLYTAMSALIFLLFFITHYFCWRLWLDERLFMLLNCEDDLTSFDEGMSQLWTVKSGKTRTLAERWLGARRLFYKTLGTAVLLWLASLCSVLYLSLTLTD